MKKNLKVVVNGKAYRVEIEDSEAAEMTVKVNGDVYRVTVDADGEPAAVKAAPAQPALIAPPVKAAAAAPAAGGNTLVAPMPGVIQDISVKAGDKVSYGQWLCTLEAMKMKNAIRAPKEAVIAAVEVQEGQKVAHGDVMFRFA